MKLLEEEEERNKKNYTKRGKNEQKLKKISSHIVLQWKPLYYDTTFLKRNKSQHPLYYDGRHRTMQKNRHIILQSSVS
jgi:hypothetical protein